MEKQRKEARKKERMELREEKHRVESTIGQKIDKFDPETMEDEKIEKESNSATTTKTPTILTAVHETPRVAHAQSHDLSHSEPVSNFVYFRVIYHSLACLPNVYMCYSPSRAAIILRMVNNIQSSSETCKINL